MAINNRGLGRGIRALLGDDNEIVVKDPASPLQSAPLDLIQPSPQQPRAWFDEESLNELAASIRQHGILQPLLVRPRKDQEGYYLVAGERRLRAAHMAGLKEAPILIRDLNENEALIVTLLENLQREDLNPIEEARGIAALRDAMNADLEELSETLGQPKSTLANALRLLNLDPKIQEDIEAKRISASHAKLLCSITSPSAIMDLRKHIINEGLTTRQLTQELESLREEGYFSWNKPPNVFTRKSPAVGSDYRQAYLSQLSDDIGAKLNCKAKVSGDIVKGRISLSYSSNAQLQELLGKLGLDSETEV